MPGRLVVILGAGASADSASARVAGRELNWRPPLVTELFAERFVNTLNQYPVAQAAAADIRRVEQSSLSIEQFLRETYADRQEALPRSSSLFPCTYSKFSFRLVTNTPLSLITTTSCYHDYLICLRTQTSTLSS